MENKIPSVEENYNTYEKIIGYLLSKSFIKTEEYYDEEMDTKNIRFVYPKEELSIDSVSILVICNISREPHNFEILSIELQYKEFVKTNIVDEKRYMFTDYLSFEGFTDQIEDLLELRRKSLKDLCSEKN